MPTVKNTPQYAALAAYLLARITSGELVVGSLLPTEQALSKAHSLSRQTVREALRRLANLGLVARQPGVGTRVIRMSAENHYACSISSMAELEGYADEAHLVISSVERVSAKAQTARLLSCREAAPWLLVRGVRYRRQDASPIGVSSIYLRDEYEGLEHEVRRLEGAFHVMLARRYGEWIEEIRQDARAVTISPADAATLGAVPGAPAMEVVRRYYGKGDRLILSGSIIYPAERFSYAMRFRRADVS